MLWLETQIWPPNTLISLLSTIRCWPNPTVCVHTKSCTCCNLIAKLQIDLLRIRIKRVMYFPSVTKYVNLKIELVTFFQISRNIFSFDVLSLRKNVVFLTQAIIIYIGYYIYWILLLCLTRFMITWRKVKSYRKSLRSSLAFILRIKNVKMYKNYRGKMTNIDLNDDFNLIMTILVSELHVIKFRQCFIY